MTRPVSERAASAVADLDAPADCDEPLDLRAVRAAIGEIWADLFQRPVGDRDDFFMLGGDSLLAMRMLVEIDRRFSCSLTPAALLRTPTIAQLASVVYRAGPRTLPRSAVGPANLASARPPLFLAYPLGGHGLRYRPLARALGQGCPLHVLESPWWDGRPAQIRTAEELAAHHITEIKRHQPTGPYLLGGYSSGGLIALEMARQLSSRGDEVALLAVIDTYVGMRPGTGMDPRHQAGGRALSARGRLRLLGDTWVWRASGTAKRLLRPARRLQWWIDHRRRGAVPERRRAPFVQDLVTAALGGYRPPSYGGRVVLLRCADDSWPEPDRGWGQVAAGELDIRDVRARHFEVLKPPWVLDLAAVLGEIIRDATPTPA